MLRVRASLADVRVLQAGPVLPVLRESGVDVPARLMDRPSPEDLYLDQMEIDRRRVEAADRAYPSCGRCGWRHRATTADCLYPLAGGDSGEVPISTEADHGE